MFVVCITASAGLFAALILKKDRPEYALFVIVLTSLLLALRIMGVLETVMGELQQWDTLLGEKRQYVNLLLKLIGITYLCEFAANLCKDAGYGTLSNHIELFGKITIMVSGLPVLKLMIEMLEDMILTAVNDAMKQIDELTEKEMAKVTGGMKLPGMF